MDSSLNVLGDDEQSILRTTYYYRYIDDITTSVQYSESGRDRVFSLVGAMLIILFLHGLITQHCMYLLILQQIKAIVSYSWSINKKVETIVDVDIDHLSHKKDEIYEDRYYDKLLAMESSPISEERLLELKNSHVFEVTPLGNVLMHYTHERESFTYYSNNTIPYRYLEVVARKYVIMNHCQSLYIDMNKELENSRIKLEEKKKVEERMKTTEKVVQKNKVFAKFKSYNKLGGTRSVKDTQTANNTKNNSNKITGNNNILLKEKANVYSYEGKMLNFNFLKKVDRKTFDQNFTMSFAEFKRMSQK